jgi:hypothetical protein
MNHAAELFGAAATKIAASPHAFDPIVRTD